MSLSVFFVTTFFISSKSFFPLFHGQTGFIITAFFTLFVRPVFSVPVFIIP